MSEPTGRSCWGILCSANLLPYYAVDPIIKYILDSGDITLWTLGWPSAVDLARTGLVETKYLF